MNELHLFLLHLQQPEYVHVLLNPLPLYGMAAGVFCLAIGLWSGSLEAQRPALLWIVCVGILTWLAIQYGEKGYDRVLSMSSPDAQLWLKVHAHRAGRCEFLFYLTAAAALAALVTRPFLSKLSRWLAGVTLILAILCCLAGAWISQAGGQIRHSEFRDGPPAASAHGPHA